MNKIILADNQAVFRAGAARVLALEEDMRIIAQCDDAERVQMALAQFSNSILLFGTSLNPDYDVILAACHRANSSIILLTENSEELPVSLTSRAQGLLSRSVSAAELTECIRRIARGQRFVHKSTLAELRAPDAVGLRVRERLTPRELQIVGLIVQGCKNKEIATQLGTKEQVIKNYLRSIYDKTGVSDRLELALFTLHHRILAEAASNASPLIEMRPTA